MSVSENLKDLDVRNLPGLKLEDDAGNVMIVHHIDLPASSQADLHDDPKEGEALVVLVDPDRSRKREVELEELKRWAINGEVEIVSGP